MVNTVFCVLKNDFNKVLGVYAEINGIRSNYPIAYLLQNNIKFGNAVICSNGVVRGKGCELQHTIIGASKNSIVLYHGSPNNIVVPIFGLGDDKHDYGRGLYTTRNIELAKEWAVCLGNQIGYVHSFELDLTGLKCFNFNDYSALSWLAELMKHRDADSSARYRRMSKIFIRKFGLDISDYDVIIGWRADSSYFSIAKRFVRNEIDYTLLNKLLRLGDLEDQYCIKSEKAFRHLKSVGTVLPVDSTYTELYQQRDSSARLEISRVIDSDENTMTKGFDYVISEGFRL